MTEKEFRNKERQRAEENLSKKKKKKKRKGAVAVLILLVVILFVAVVSVVATILLRINTITVDGNAVYTDKDIIDCLDIKEGDSLIFLAENKLSLKIQKEMPYITGIDIKIQLPDKINISVTETYEEICYYDNEKFYTANPEGKFLKESLTKPSDMPVVVSGDGIKFALGEYFACENENKKTLINSIFAFAERENINVTILSVKDVYNAYFIIDDAILVELGSVSYLEQKLQFVPKTVEMMKDGERNVINLSAWSPDNNEAVSYEKNISDYISLN